VDAEFVFLFLFHKSFFRVIPVYTYNRLVTNVGSRTKKTFANVKLPGLNQTILVLNNKFRDIRLVCKQIWYVPFIWSLSWFSFWILRDVVVLNKSVVEANPVNYFGAIISIVALLLAVPSFGTIIRKTSVLVGTQIGMRTKNAFFLIGVHIKSGRIRFPRRKKLVQNIKVDKLMQQKLRLKHQSTIEKSQTAMLETPKQLKQPSSSLKTFPGRNDYSGQHQLPQEIPAECLTCANLVNCDYRRNGFIESENEVQKPDDCRLAAERSINKAVAS
jgi:hypothetical protein